MSIPNIIGFTLGEAVKMLQEAGIYVCGIKLTAPPRHMPLEYEENDRVARYTPVGDGKVEIVVCKQMKMRGLDVSFT